MLETTNSTEYKVVNRVFKKWKGQPCVRGDQQKEGVHFQLGGLYHDLPVMKRTEVRLFIAIAGKYSLNLFKSNIDQAFFLPKWDMVASAACALCGAPAETQSHIQCLCPVLKDASILAHYNDIAHRLWRGILDASENSTYV